MAGLITERIPHKTVAYAFLEVQASTANEFEKLRAEALKRAPHYGFAAQAPAEPKTVAPVEVAAEQAEETVAPAEASGNGQETPTPSQPQAEQASAGAAPSTQGLSPREIAKAKMAAKKEAQSG